MGDLIFFHGSDHKTAVFWLVVPCNLGTAKLCHLATKLNNITTHDNVVLKYLLVYCINV